MFVASVHSCLIFSRKEASRKAIAREVEPGSLSWAISVTEVLCILSPVERAPVERIPRILDEYPFHGLLP
jgi:hypothetical protein